MKIIETKSGNSKKITKIIMLFSLMFLLFSDNIFAAVFEFSLVQRRRYDQIHVEIWAKKVSETNLKLGNSSLIVSYNQTYLAPAILQDRNTTDSIYFDVNQSNPINTITSSFGQAANGYNSLGSQSYGVGLYSLEVILSTLGSGGLSPSSEGKGSFVGKLVFDIINAPPDSALSNIVWSINNTPGQVVVSDVQGNRIEDSITFNNPANFKIVGITVLSPNLYRQVVDRDMVYAGLTGDYSGGGYPIYFERSVNPSLYTGTVGSGLLDDRLAYQIQYSKDNGSNWKEIGRVAETNVAASVSGIGGLYRSGEIFNPNTTVTYIITSQDGSQIIGTNYRKPVRVVWMKNTYFSERSEQARLKITQLNGDSKIDITTRTSSNNTAINDTIFILGRLFFLQLDGKTQYLKTLSNYSNSTQLTVEAWVNINSYKAIGSEPAIVATSGGPGTELIGGSKEGAWMLYLKDGRFPAFRVREIQSRGDNGYIAQLAAYNYDTIPFASDSAPLNDAHAKNWTHIAATVNNNIVTLYVNGEIVDKVVNNNATDIRMLTTLHPIWVGVNPNDSLVEKNFLHAGIKNVCIWRSALSQDDIRKLVAGIPVPTKTDYGNIRRSLELFYSFEGIRNDLASDASYQNGQVDANYYLGSELSNNKIYFRPDQPHIKITAPSLNAGVTNRQGKTSEIRWVSYGIGDIVNQNTKDVDVEYSLDYGITWNFAKNSSGANLGGSTAIDVETGNCIWEPYQNNSTGADLRTINPYAKNTLLRVKGTVANTQSELLDVTKQFTVAPYFSMKLEKGSIPMLAASDGMNITGNVAFLEAWIRPYSFPSNDDYYPIITKIDSTNYVLHYSLDLLPTGQLRLQIADSDGLVRTAKSDADEPIVRPNSIANDSAWTHVGAYIFLNNGFGQSEVRFFIDGKVQRADTLASQLGTNLTVNTLNQFPTYFGYRPSYTLLKVGVDSQTQNVIVGGNLYSGNSTGNIQTTSTTIYDNSSKAHSLTLSMTKVSTANTYTFNVSVDNTEPSKQTQNVFITGKLNSAATTGTSVKGSVNILDYKKTSHTLTANFTKTSNTNEYELTITLDATKNIYQGTHIFSSGLISSELLIFAQDLNQIFGSQIFDQISPKNISINIKVKDSTTNNAVTVFDSTFANNVLFSSAGTLLSPTAFTVNSYDINNALGTTYFDATTPKNILIDLSRITNYVLPNSFTIIGNDGSEATTLTGYKVIEPSHSFIGEMREVRFWRGTPNNAAITGIEPTSLTIFVQGSQSTRSENLSPQNSVNLHSYFSFNGGSFIINGWARSVGISNSNNVIAKYFSKGISFVPTEPHIKLVEPYFKQRVPNTKADLRVRWVGFDYDSSGFFIGAAGQTPSLEFSIRGGGGVLIQPYQYVGSRYWVGNSKDAISFPNNTLYRFINSNNVIYYGLQLDASISDPDLNNDGTFSDQGPLSASLTNARFRLTGQYSINGTTKKIQSEGPLFTITPPSNFTVRVLLEGYHNGNIAGSLVTQLGTGYKDGGLKIKLYSDNSGGLGALIDTAESTEGYDDRNPMNRNANSNRFANVNFVFTDINDGSYWVMLDHINHLPIMSRFPANFQFTGDERSTWAIESGWDFQTWNGVDNNILTSANNNPWTNGSYTAEGDAISTKTKAQYSTTGLNYNNGVAGGAASPLPAMVGGDVVKDNQINAADRVQVRQDNGTGLRRSDVTGDGYVNADDRTICDRNYGKISSLVGKIFPAMVYSNEEPVQAIANETNPMEFISDLDIKMSKTFVDNAKKVRVQAAKGEKLAANLKYKVYAEPSLNGNYIDVDFYIQNQGSEFALANCTFAITYNSSQLSFSSLEKKSTVKFCDNPEKGYGDLKSAPSEDAVNPLPDVRTIEIDYDAYAQLSGEVVSTSKDYLGTLRFSLKHKNSVVKFSWHDSKSVHTTTGLVATRYGTFDSIAPVLLYTADIVTPNGGERIPPKKKHTIKWTTTGAALANLEYSFDGGFSWGSINTNPIALNTLSYEWTAPDIYSTQCLVRLVDVESGVELVRSDNVFSILPNYAYLNRPSSGDAVYRGNVSEEIVWTNQGYKKFTVEFSANGGYTWTTISTGADATAGYVNWKIPKITTKTAVIRLIDEEDGSEAARSTYFKILNGSVVFKSPRQAETLYGNKTSRVRWAAVDLKLFDLQYSVDGGVYWVDLQKNTDATSSYLNWNVVNIGTELGLIRAIWNGDSEMEYARTDVFIIVPNTGVADELPYGYSFELLAPNPTKSETYVNFAIPEPQTIKAKILTETGQTVQILNDKFYDSGKNNIRLDVNSLASGTYFVIIESENFKVMRKIQVIK